MGKREGTLDIREAVLHAIAPMWGTRFGTPEDVAAAASRVWGDLLFTTEEHDAMKLSGKLAGKLRKIIGSGSCADADWAEAAHRIHSIQSMILAQAASRAYPDRYRLLGGWSEPGPECGDDEQVCGGEEPSRDSVDAEVSRKDQIVVLKCKAHNHITLWQADLLPYPTTCPCSVSNAWRSGRCSSELHNTGNYLVAVMS